MDKEKLFIEFLEECKKNNQICGAGNHNSNILLVGNEHYSETPIDDKKYLESNYEYCANTKSWSNFNKSKTWLYYQKLIDAAIPNRLKPTVRGERNFEEDAFTTELNSEAKPSSRVKGKEEREELRKRIKSRLELFEKSDFIKSFPVVVLACGSYLTNSVEKGITQINDTFCVKFDEQLNGKGVPVGWHKSDNGKLWFTTHHSKDKRKLVIHTWQFSLRCTKREDREWLINEMATVIRDHLAKLGLI